MTDKDQKLRQELAETKKRLKETERELVRKEKALAEMAALMALKKKANAIWGDDEED
ncbi:MAG: transposase [Nitrososphaerota archaeon]|nr:transposase [Nitrososphaerota archaeon]